PLGCTLELRSERSGLPILSHQFRISELPGHTDPSQPAREPRHSKWHERTMSVRLPRGPRRTDWGVVLRASDGTLLDERPVVTRVEAISFAMHVNGGTEPASKFTVGDQKPPPTEKEIGEAKAAADEVFAEARDAAARRRFSTAGDLEQYLI